MTVNLVVLASGRGSNFKAILENIKNGLCDAKVLALICDNPKAMVINTARDNNIFVHIIERKNFESREIHDDAIFAAISKYSPDLIVLAGYMRVLKSKKIFANYKNRILNIHPSLLPKFKGLDAQKQAFLAGESVSGITIHLVDESLDGGRILFQKEVNISECKSAEEVSDKLLTFEHKYYSFVIDQIAKAKIELK